MEDIPRHKDPQVIEAPEGFGEDELLSGLLLSGMPRARPAVPPSEEAEQRALEQSQVLRQDPQRPRYPLRGASAQQVGQGMFSCACKPCEPASGDPVHVDPVDAMLVPSLPSSQARPRVRKHRKVKDRLEPENFHSG